MRTVTGATVIDGEPKPESPAWSAEPGDPRAHRVAGRRGGPWHRRLARPTTRPQRSRLEPDHTLVVVVPGVEWGDEVLPVAT
jgi:TRPM family ion channel